MKLVRVRVEGYRSIREPLELQIDGRVTVLLGANDHGKTNLLEAMLHLNKDDPFEKTDLNWDCAALATTLPRVEGEFELDDRDKETLAAFEEETRAVARETEDPAGADFSTFTAKAVPKTLVFERVGLSGSLVARPAKDLSSDAVASFVAEGYPRLEIFHPVDTLPDAATALNLVDDDHEFIRGIFRLADLKEPWDPYFTKTHATARRLDRASETLNEVLRTSWTQGADLTFHLRHDSATAEIEIMVEDPAVTDQYVRVSRRSSGFTNFFGLKTTLYAREQASAANSYIWLFDEPGLSLHPSGQQDLLQAIEGIGRSNQVVYTTHSLFLINKNFPTRHRLIVKTDHGTQVDAKPFVGRWRSAIEALGLSLPGTILFAGQVLLAEGDTDGVLLLAAFQALIEQGQLDLDLNAFSVVGTGDTAKAYALIQVLTEARPTPRISRSSLMGTREARTDCATCAQSLSVSASRPRPLLRERRLRTTSPTSISTYAARPSTRSRLRSYKALASTPRPSRANSSPAMALSSPLPARRRGSQSGPGGRQLPSPESDLYRSSGSPASMRTQSSGSTRRSPLPNESRIWRSG